MIDDSNNARKQDGNRKTKNRKKKMHLQMKSAGPPWCPQCNISPADIIIAEVWSGTAAVVQHRAIRGLAEVGAVGGSHQHRGARGAGQQGDGAVVLVLEHRVLASYGAQPGVPVAAVF